MQPWLPTWSLRHGWFQSSSLQLEQMQQMFSTFPSCEWCEPRQKTHCLGGKILVWRNNMPYTSWRYLYIYIYIYIYMHEVSNGVHRCPCSCNAMKGMVKLLRLSRISRLDLADICLTDGHPCIHHVLILLINQHWHHRWSGWSGWSVTVHFCTNLHSRQTCFIQVHSQHVASQWRFIRSVPELVIILKAMDSEIRSLSHMHHMHIMHHHAISCLNCFSCPAWFVACFCTLAAFKVQYTGNGLCSKISVGILLRLAGLSLRPLKTIEDYCQVHTDFI